MSRLREIGTTLAPTTFAERRARRMAACKTPVQDVRLAVIARLLGDHRTAPNLWLARKIVQELDDLATNAMNPARQPTGAPGAPTRHSGRHDDKVGLTGSEGDRFCGQ
jgi:hypothetical protein